MEDLASHDAGNLDLSAVAGLAKMGSSGAHAENVWRDLKAWMPKPKLPGLHTFDIPYKHSILGMITETTKMLLPHELFSAIYNHYPKMWKECICPSAETCLRFWSCVRGGLQFAQHPVSAMTDLSKVIPLRFHGDGTPASGAGKSWGKMVDIFSLSSMLVVGGSSMIHNFMIWMVHQTLLSAVAGHHTMNTFWKKFSWSCKALAEGLSPMYDWTGKLISRRRVSLMGGYCMYIWACIGDLDYWTKTLELPNSNSNTPCALCPCNSTTMPWWDFRPTAAWIMAIYTAWQWANSGWARCGLFECPGVNVLSLHPDWMHVKHLGIDKVLLGSTLWVLVNWILPGDDAAAKLSVIWHDIVRIYREDNVSTRYGQLKMTMFTTGNTPKIKGKAGEIKCLGPVLVKVFQAYMNPELTVHVKILTMLRLSAHLDSIIDKNAAEFALGEQDSTDLVATGFGYLSLFYEVSETFRTEEVALFSLTAKAHYLMHICLLSRSYNFTICLGKSKCVCVCVCVCVCESCLRVVY